MASAPNIERLYDDHAPALFAFLLNLLCNDADTQDVLQELFIKLARRPALLENVRAERGFVLRLAHNLAVDLMRPDFVPMAQALGCRGIRVDGLAALAAQSDDLQTQIWQGGGTAFMKGREWRAAWCRPDGQVGHGKATR